MKYSLVAFSLFLAAVSVAQTTKLKQTTYRAVLSRPDGNEVVFNMLVKTEKGKPVFYVMNDTERLRVGDIKQSGDSLFFNMPVFESSFRTAIQKDGSLQGTWIKGTAKEPQRWSFRAMPGQSVRFSSTRGIAKHIIAGKWVVTFTNATNNESEKALAIFKQQKNRLTGSFLTSSGDYRYLDGIVTGDSLKLSTFDGSHAYYFNAKINNENEITGGSFFAGYAGFQKWSAVRDDQAALPALDAPTALKPGETGLNFSFNDLNDQPVSLKDERFKDKVVIVDIMGSWCPNCMDEAGFLTEFYKNNKKRGVEIIALAYEYTTDLQRSKASLEKFRKTFNIEYPVLITGVPVTDERLTEKTLPQITPIRSFPTTIIIDKKGNVREIQSVFYGPGTGEYYERFVRDFNKTVDGLLKE